MGGWKGGWVGWFAYEMKGESLEGYLSPRLTNGSNGSSGVGQEGEEVDACWAWSSTVLERTEEGEWIARGVVDDEGAKQTNGRNHTNGHGTSKTPSMIDWLLNSGISLTVSSKQLDQYTERIQTILLSGSLDVQPISPAKKFPTFHPVNSGEDYCKRIDACRENIRQGESYELTLTTRFLACASPGSQTASKSDQNDGINGESLKSQEETRSTNGNDASQEVDDVASRQNDPYRLYLRLRSFNPAYYSSYLSFPTILSPTGKGIHILSSSPERFLRITSSLPTDELLPSSTESDSSTFDGKPRSVSRARRVEMKPIKGTRARVKPYECVCMDGEGCRGMDPGSIECLKEGQRVDVRRGEELQEDVKERAENLMVSSLFAWHEACKLITRHRLWI